MVCNRMDVGASYFAIRELAGCTNMIRRTRISVRRNCIWVKSAWSVRGQGRWLLRCGRLARHAGGRRADGGDVFAVGADEAGTPRMGWTDRGIARELQPR